jgi:RNA:NAD 2'-phosphotransferase (TPT1/KptA family)
MPKLSDFKLQTATRNDLVYKRSNPKSSKSKKFKLTKSAYQKASKLIDDGRFFDEDVAKAMSAVVKMGPEKAYYHLQKKGYLNASKVVTTVYPADTW